MLTIPADDARAVAVVEAIHDGDVGGLRQLLDDNRGLAQARIVDRRGASRTLIRKRPSRATSYCRPWALSKPPL